MRPAASRRGVASPTLEQFGNWLSASAGEFAAQHLRERWSKVDRRDDAVDRSRPDARTAREEQSLGAMWSRPAGAIGVLDHPGPLREASPHTTGTAADRGAAARRIILPFDQQIGKLVEARPGIEVRRTQHASDQGSSGVRIGKFAKTSAQFLAEAVDFVARCEDAGGFPALDVQPDSGETGPGAEPHLEGSRPARLDVDRLAPAEPVSVDPLSQLVEGDSDCGRHAVVRRFQPAL